MTELEILYRDKHLIAINKPHGLLVHRTGMAANTNEFALQMLRDQIGQRVYPAHRLDRKTGGVLLFTLDNDSDSKMQQLFANGEVSKTYLAILRGYTPDEGSIDYPLKKENGKLQDALTIFKTIAKAEISLPSHQHESSRFSLVAAFPKTGRMHQIRRHFAHIFHPIIGDRPHGCNKQNKIFKEKLNMTTMMLHALEVRFVHPITKQEVCIRTYPGDEFMRVCKLMGWQNLSSRGADLVKGK